ncbi:Fungal G-protein, alpha subunit [Histomonas meleagridis]|uniref:Fungal G-protein, alpha subunit n=1 Tax=Histomonas meleagridis TaxID=135588 RepID=UPI0035593AA0|nr:Fungal G-protein, alpha subunit [Histomonas meleagridis]KAH0798150.1 Fungal G-protein, alpha subunit [Histomonas meleagridis]
MGCNTSTARATEQSNKLPSCPKPSVVKNTLVEPVSEKTDFISILFDQFDKFDIKILTLGSGECGKSTIWRQLKLVYGNGFSTDEKNAMISVIKINLIADFQLLVKTIKSNGGIASYNFSNTFDMILELQLNEDELIPDVAHEMKQLWENVSAKEIYEESNSIGFGDYTSYFFDKVETIADPNYTPTDEDLLKSRIRTTGISSIQFLINDIKTELFDVGGQLSERPKWKRCYQNVNFLLFVISLSDFDQNMFEDESNSRTKDSLNLFSSIANSQIFMDTPIFLVMNKVDLFKQKLKNHPEAFKSAYDFDGECDNVDVCLEYVKRSYLNMLSNDRTENAFVMPIPTCAMEAESIRSLFQQIGKKIIETKGNE